METIGHRQNLCGHAQSAKAVHDRIALPLLDRKNAVLRRSGSRKAGRTSKHGVLLPDLRSGQHGDQPGRGAESVQHGGLAGNPGERLLVTERTGESHGDEFAERDTEHEIGMEPAAPSMPSRRHIAP